MNFSSSAFLMALAMASSRAIPSVTAELTTDEAYNSAKLSATSPPPGFNAEGTSVFTNFVNAVNEGQLFFFRRNPSVDEEPGSDPVLWTGVQWCGDLTFSDFTNSSSPMGLAGRCVAWGLGGWYASYIEAGAQLASDYSAAGFSYTEGISAVYVEQTNVFEGQIHGDTDGWIGRYWDSGRPSSPYLSFEGHDQGNMAPDASLSSLSSFGELFWVSVDEFAQLLNTSTDEFTPENFKKVYKDTWIKSHEQEAAKKNPNAEAELEIIAQVDGTQASDENETPAQSDASGADGDTPAEAEDASSGSGRKLASVSTRFVSAALRVFGI